MEYKIKVVFVEVTIDYSDKIYFETQGKGEKKTMKKWKLIQEINGKRSVISNFFY